MPTAGQWTWPNTLDAIIRDEANAAGVPLDLAYTFIAVESSFNPDTYVNTALEESVGLLELNRRGGQGAGYSVAELKDPRRNLQIGLPYIRAAFESSWTAGIAPRTFIYLVATRSGHPGQIAETDYRMENIRNAWAIFYPAVGASLQGPTPGNYPRHAPAPAAMAALAIPFTGFAAPAMLMSALFPSFLSGAIFPSLQNAVLPSREGLLLRQLHQLGRAVLPDPDEPDLTWQRRRRRRGPEGGAGEVNRALSGRPGSWREGRFVYS